MLPMNPKPPVSALLLTLSFATVIDVGAGWLLRRPELSPSLRMLVALSPIPANLLLVGLIVTALRRLDEFLRHVHFEAIAIGFMLTGLAVFIYGYLQMARAVPPLNFGIVWLFMVLFYGIGYVIAARHYR